MYMYLYMELKIINLAMQHKLIPVTTLLESREGCDCKNDCLHAMICRGAGE